MLEFLLVGKKPLGSAIRAGMLGVIVTILGMFLMRGIWYGSLFAFAGIAIALPIIYLISKRDNSWGESTAVPGNADAKAAAVAPIFVSRDFDETAAFWKGLGFRETARFVEPDGYLMLERDGLEIHFVENPKHVPTDSWHAAYFSVPDADKLHSEFSKIGLVSQGIPRLSDIEDKEWGVREFHVVDTDGTLLRFGCPLATV